MKLKKFTEKDLRQSAATSFSLRETLKKLKVAPAGGNYYVLKRAIEYFKIDTSHFTGKAHLRGRTHKHSTRPIESILTYGKHENTFRLKNRLIKEGLKDEVCESCNLRFWKEIKIPLELHHRDGDRKNNQLFNLELLCPNCHAFTDNYRGKNKKV